MFLLKCYFFKKKDILTVGDIQKVFCPLTLQEQSLLKANEHFLIKKNYPMFLLDYKLVLIKPPIIKKDLLSLDVTSYIPGTFNNLKPILKVNKHSFLLSNLSWKVKTLLKKNSKVQGFYGPLIEKNSLNPLYTGLGLFLFFILYFLYYFVRKYKYQKIQKQQIVKYKNTLSPYNEYHKKIRSIDLKSNDLFSLVKKALYIFLIRSTGIPFFQYSLSRVKKEIKKNKQFSGKQINTLFFILEDFKNIPSNFDLEKRALFLNKVNQIVDKIEEVL